MNQNYANQLAEGKTVSFRPRGNSMNPRIVSGQLVTIKPCEPSEIEKDDIVFCKVKGRFYVHLVQSVQKKMGGYRFQIGNMKNHTNGTIGENLVFGKVVQIEN